MKIDKGIQLPQKYPFDAMAVGDSFAVPSHIKRPTVTVAAMRYGQKNGMKFTVRQVKDRSLRCWRVA